MSCLRQIKFLVFWTLGGWDVFLSIVFIFIIFIFKIIWTFDYSLLMLNMHSISWYICRFKQMFKMSRHFFMEWLLQFILSHLIWWNCFFNQVNILFFFFFETETNQVNILLQLTWGEKPALEWCYYSLIKHELLLNPSIFGLGSPYAILWLIVCVFLNLFCIRDYAITEREATCNWTVPSGGNIVNWAVANYMRLCPPTLPLTTWTIFNLPWNSNNLVLINLLLSSISFGFCRPLAILTWIFTLFYLLMRDYVTSEAKSLT